MTASANMPTDQRASGRVSGRASGRVRERATAEANDRPNELFVTEIFSAIQGEAKYVGERQIFVRLAGCNIRCDYCDQPEALEKVPGPCRIERTPGARDFETLSSPLPASDVLASVDLLAGQLPHHSVSLTGGEPLFQGARLEHLVPELAARGHGVYLETNGMLVHALARIAEHVRHISMDLKLHSVDGEHVDQARQRDFLEVAAQSGADVFCKIVVGPGTDEAELTSAVRMVAATAPGCEVFLQPVTPFGEVEAAPTPEQVLTWQASCLGVHPHVRVIPQTHKMIAQL